MGIASHVSARDSNGEFKLNVDGVSINVDLSYKSRSGLSVLTEETPLPNHPRIFGPFLTRETVDSRVAAFSAFNLAYSFFSYVLLSICCCLRS